MEEEVIYKKEKLKESLLQLIKNFREEYKKLDKLEKKHIHNAIDYSPPCQIELFWLSEPLEYQIVVITHNTDRKDMEIIINGPYEGYEFSERVEKIMQEDRWNKPIPEDSHYYIEEELGTTKYSDIFADLLFTFINSIIKSVFSEIGTITREGYGFPTGWCSFVEGNILNIDCNKLLEEFINEAKLRAKIIREKSYEIYPKIREMPKLVGYGTYYYPPIWVNKIPERTFRHIISDYFPAPVKILHTSFNGVKIIVYSDGFIGIVTENKEQAIRIVNTIFGVSLISGINCFAANESEIAYIKIDPNSFEIHTKSMKSSSLRGHLLIGFGPSDIRYYHREIIKEEVIKELIKKAEKISKYEDLSQQLIFLLAGYTYYANSEYSQSFIINWIIVEKYLFKLWKNLLAEKGLTGKRKKKLIDSILWGTDYILETLNLNGNIDKETYDLIMDLKKKRNKFIHEGQLMDQSSSEKLLNFCRDRVKDNLSKVITIDNDSK